MANETLLDNLSNVQLSHVETPAETKTKVGYAEGTVFNDIINFGKNKKLNHVDPMVKGDIQSDNPIAAALKNKFKNILAYSDNDQNNDDNNFDDDYSSPTPVSKVTYTNQLITSKESTHAMGESQINHIVMASDITATEAQASDTKGNSSDVGAVKTDKENTDPITVKFFVPDLEIEKLNQAGKVQAAKAKFLGLNHVDETSHQSDSINKTKKMPGKLGDKLAAFQQVSASPSA